MGKTSSPAAPDYAGAANATAEGNLDAARAAAAANRVNQQTPYGNLTYSHAGTDPDGGWTATQTLSPGQQGILDQTTKLNSGLMGTAQSGLDYANGVLSKPGVDTSQLPQVGINPGQSYQDAMMSRLSPQIDRENEQSDAQLANQGIMPGSEAYNNAKTQLSQQHNDLLNSATVQGFNTGLSANQNAFQQQSYNQMQPINVINALRTGSQVQGPSFTNVPQQSTTAGADLLSAANGQYGSALDANNVSNSNKQQTTNTAATLGMMAMMMSDRRLKSNIKRLGTLPNGLGWYSYHIGSRDDEGVMADEVEQLIPSAVITMASGFKAVDYAQVFNHV